MMLGPSRFALNFYFYKGLGFQNLIVCFFIMFNLIYYTRIRGHFSYKIIFDEIRLQKTIFQEFPGLSFFTFLVWTFYFP